jgi:hypothetical protein
MQCEKKLKSRSHDTSFFLIEVVTKEGSTVYNSNFTSGKTSKKIDVHENANHAEHMCNKTRGSGEPVSLT